MKPCVLCGSRDSSRPCRVADDGYHERPGVGESREDVLRRLVRRARSVRVISKQASDGEAT